ncbi:MAG: UDP-N-acetylmuramate dehydrogenase [Candidatus Spechtbacterales bacterium]
MIIKENVNLASHTTYKIGGPARYFAECRSEDNVLEALAFAKEKNIPYFILGGGSNVLVSDKGYGGVIVAIRNDNYELKNNILSAEAGVMMRALVEETASEGMEGLEWAGGLPGQLGGAIRGNAGAFGGEIKDVIKSVKAVTPAGEIKEFKNSECNFEYRTSIFKEEPGHIILSAEMELKEGDRAKLLERVAELVEWRRSKHPMEYGNSGSIFKRKDLKEVEEHIIKKYPHIEHAIRDGQVATAFFIDEAGLKLKRVGGAEVSEKHPNFIINKSGTARAEDVTILAGLVKSSVLHQFGIVIEEEIQYLG